MWWYGRTTRGLLTAVSRVKVRSHRRGSSKVRPSPGRPPWRVLFFGSDQFAVESLKQLTFSRNTSEATVETLEVVTLSGDIPVKRFAQQNHLKLHSWPPGDVEGQFDVGVVVSFGCLIHKRLINMFPYGILNVHPSLLPRWRGPAPIFHTIMHGDTVTGVTIIQILPHKFDVGPILNQELYQVPESSTADELGAALAVRGAHLLIDTLMKLPEKIENKREQGQTGATFAPKISSCLSWMVWEEQTCEQIARLYRAIGSRMPLRTIWMGNTIKLLDFVGKYHMPGPRQSPGSLHYDKDSSTLAVRCKDGCVGFKSVLLHRRLTAADFYNGYLHQVFQRDSPSQKAELLFVSKRTTTEAHQKHKKTL